MSSEIEVSVFGPGYGESVAVHVGAGHWIIVDSCIDKASGEPATLKYLRSIGVDVARNVDLLVATHWHDDHVRGLSKVLRACNSARFCCASALTKREFLASVLPYERQPKGEFTSGIKELSEILEILRSDSRGSVLRAIADRSIYRLSDTESGHGLECEIFTLSPSDKQFDAFLLGITKMMPKIGETKRRAVNQEPNPLSVVVCIRVGQGSLLLGADLEETADAETGWSVIVGSKQRPQQPSSVFKIPHHGSENGHNTEVWERMLTTNPFALLTPYNRGPKKLPSGSDISRITALTKEAYITSTVKPGKPYKRDPAVERQIREMKVVVRRAEALTGQIRLRAHASCVESPSAWTVDCIGPAGQLA